MMVWIYVFAAIAVVCAFFAWYKCIKLYSLKCKNAELTSELEESDRTIERQDAEIEKKTQRINELAMRNAEFQHLSNSGWRNVRIKHLITPEHLNYPRNQVCVVGLSSRNPSLFFIIKTFEYDRDSEEDYEFAMREAEDLIEKIQEK